MVRAVIGDLHELECRLLIRCEACLHQVVFLPSEAVARFGWRMRVADLRPRLKCSKCNATARDGKVVMGLVAADVRAKTEREDREALHPEGVKDRSPGGRRRLHSRPEPRVSDAPSPGAIR
jgi:hypothetical protein